MTSTRCPVETTVSAGTSPALVSPGTVAKSSAIAPANATSPTGSIAFHEDSGSPGAGTRAVPPTRAR